METPRSAFKAPWSRNSPAEIMDLDSPEATPIAPLQSTALREANEEIYHQQQEITKLRDQLKRANSLIQTLQESTQQKDAQIQRLIEEKTQVNGENLTLRRKFDEVRLTLEQKARAAEMEAEHDRARLSTCMQQLSTAVAAEQRVRSEFKALDLNSAQLRRDLEAKLETTKQQRDDFKRQFEALRQEVLVTKSDLQGSSLLQEQLKLSKERILELETQLTQMRKRGFDSMESQSQIDSLKMTIQQQEATMRQMQENQSQAASQAASATYVHQLEQENRNMKEEVIYMRKRAEEVDALREQVRAFSNTKHMMEKLEQDIAKLRVENESLKTERSAWEGFLSGLSGFESPEQIKRNLAEMQHQNLALFDANGKLTTEVKRVTKLLEDRAAEMNKLTEQIVAERDKADDAQRSLEYTNVRLRESERRCKSFEEILQSYRMEESLPINNFDAAKAAQIRELERQLAEKDQHIIKIEAEAESLRQSGNKLEKEIDRLLQERETLQSRIGRGDYNAAATKILHFAFTPEMIKQDQANQTENTQLRERIKSLEEELAVLKSAAASGSASSFQSSNSNLADAQQKYEQMSSELRSLRQETAILKEQLQEKDYSNKRFTEVCMTRLKEFKDTCYQLFGWKIDFDDQLGRRYRLQSMFSKSGDEFLLFQYSKKQLVLLETDFTKSIDPSISAFLTQHSSIPSFLSSLSLALFERKMRK